MLTIIKYAIIIENRILLTILANVIHGKKALELWIWYVAFIKPKLMINTPRILNWRVIIFWTYHCIWLIKLSWVSSRHQKYIYLYGTYPVYFNIISWCVYEPFKSQYKTEFRKCMRNIYCVWLLWWRWQLQVWLVLKGFRIIMINSLHVFLYESRLLLILYC